jgi:hypothetical protein
MKSFPLPGMGLGAKKLPKMRFVSPFHPTSNPTLISLPFGFVPKLQWLVIARKIRSISCGSIGSSRSTTTARILRSPHPETAPSKSPKFDRRRSQNTLDRPPRPDSRPASKIASWCHYEPTIVLPYKKRSDRITTINPFFTQHKLNRNPYFLTRTSTTLLLNR